MSDETILPEQNNSVQDAPVDTSVSSENTSTDVNKPAESEISANTPNEEEVPRYTKKQLENALRESSKNIKEKAKVEALRELQEQQQRQVQQQQSAPLTEEDRTRQIVRDEQESLRRQNDAQSYYDRIGADFMGKVRAAEKSDPELFSKSAGLGLDFEKITAADPRIVLFNSIDNPGDVIDAMHKQKTKYGEIVSLLATDYENRRNGVETSLAYEELKKLSDSIKLNKAVKDAPKAPVSSTKIDPSNAGLSNGESSFASERKKSMYSF